MTAIVGAEPRIGQAAGPPRFFVTFTKNMKMIVPLSAVALLLTACGRQQADSSAIRTAGSGTPSGGANQPVGIFTNKDGDTFYVGSVTIGGSNVPLTNIQIR